MALCLQMLSVLENFKKIITQKVSHFGKPNTITKLQLFPNITPFNRTFF